MELTPTLILNLALLIVPPVVLVLVFRQWLARHMSKAVIHIPTMPTATTKTAPLFLSFIRAKNLKGGITIRNVNTGYMIRAPTPPAQHTAAEAAPLTTEYRRAADT